MARLVEEKEIRDIGYPFYIATVSGHLEVIKYLHSKMQYGSSVAFVVRVSRTTGRTLEVAQWLYRNTQVLTIYGVEDAAANGDLEMVKWFHDDNREGSSWSAMHEAAVHGHLEVVRWLHANWSSGCERDTMEICARRGDLNMMKWLHANRHDQFDLHRAIDIAAAHGHLNVVQCIHENRDEGCTTEAMDRAAGNGHLDVVKWLHEHRPEGCTTDAMDDAATNGHLEVVKWLHDNREEGCTTNAMDGAAANSHLKVVKWLRSNRSERCSPSALQWLFRKSARLNTAVFMFSEFPECRGFRLEPYPEAEWVGVVEWLIERAPAALEGRALKVKSWNRHVCDWLRQHNWKVISQGEGFSYYFVRTSK